MPLLKHMRIYLQIASSFSLRRRLLDISAIPDDLETPRVALELPSYTDAAQSNTCIQIGTVKDKDTLAESIAHQTDFNNVDEKDALPSEVEIE